MASGAARSQLAPGNRGRSAGSCRPDASALRQGRVGGATAAPGTCRAAEPAASGGGGAGRGGAGQPRCAATAPPRRLRCREGRRPAEGGAAHLPLASMRSRRPARGAAHLRLARRGSKMEAAARRGAVWKVSRKLAEGSSFSRNGTCLRKHQGERHLYPTLLHTVWGRITKKTSRKATATAEQVGACNNCVRYSRCGYI
ncbi:uncharacterized protein LOC115338763 isoform X2 [Aquila chrysaetos chrysaetos]|uniref:uncharacterized protein LOC115338763 isoform X2 n=1 Tax=Aquila chrysaetos chrysaetos TaxID=223781 RepID=UPI001176637B|nr:uncharacterized protein LOC115338763 isoform X2 [Aquila chrysaetos chrysaetos]